MDCVFICVFTNPEFIVMLNMLLESIATYGNYTQDILIYTSSVFAATIQGSTIMRPNIRFEICDTYDTIEKACCARLDWFLFASISKYSRVLYLDTDIIVKADLSRVFDCATEDVLYAVEEGVVGWSDDWGAVLFTESESAHLEKSGFNSGVLLFRNCDGIRTLFAEINADRIKRPMHLHCHDQAYIVYHAVRGGIYDNQILKTVSVNNDMNEYSNKVIHHFPGGPGTTKGKIPKMRTFLSALHRATAEHTIIPYRKSPDVSAIVGCVFSWKNTRIAFTDADVFIFANTIQGKYGMLDSRSVVLRIYGYTYRIEFDANYTGFQATCYSVAYGVSGTRIVPPLPREQVAFKRLGLLFMG